MRGINCEKALYLNKYHNELRDELSEQQRSIFSQGTRVGELAQELFPGGIDLTPDSYYDFGPSIVATQEAIQNRESVIYEAAFLFDGILAAMDIVVRTETGYKAYEVKSSTQVKDIYLQDIALQTYVIENSGLKLEDVSLYPLQKRPIYLDAAATTPVDPRVKEAMLPYFDTIFGNASSKHQYGKEAKRAIDSARAHVADIINAEA